MKNSEKTMEKIVALCKGRGFIFSGSEIYGGPAVLSVHILCRRRGQAPALPGP